MLTSLIASLALLSGPQGDRLTRIFSKGELDKYKVHSHLKVEVRPRNLDTFFPRDIDIYYGFSEAIKDVTPEGVATVHYMRPTMTIVNGETESSPEETQVLKPNMDVVLQLSTANEVLHADQKKKDEQLLAPIFVHGRGEMLTRSAKRYQQSVQDFVGHFVMEMYRMSVFVGSIEGALDLNPRLPFGPVKVGDTWKRTIGYEPQTLKGKGDEMAMQRLDYVYAYRGPMKVDGKDILRVSVNVDLDTDIATFANQLADDDTGLKTIPMKLSGQIDFNLDPKSLRTLSASATSNGSYKIILSEGDGEPIQEARFKGLTDMNLAAK
jgi:hypothetical protein